MFISLLSVKAAPFNYNLLILLGYFVSSQSEEEVEIVVWMWSKG